MSQPVISVEHLTKKYDLGVIGTGTLSRDLERWWARLRKQPDPYTRIGQEDRFKRLGESILALDDVSFTVEQGEALGIIGRNGAGKSTLLKILSRVTAPTSGVVKVKGRIGSLLEVGTGFHPELTGRENIYLNGAILGMKKAEVVRKFDEIVDFSGVEKFIDTPVKRYSSGMYVRLAFAVAAHLDPEILIVDEVLAVGDAEFQKKCLGKMGDVASEGRTVFFVSHNMQAIQNLCKRSIWLNDGQIANDGNSDKVVQRYLDKSSPKNRDIEEHLLNRGISLVIREVHLEDEKNQPIVNPISGTTIDIVINYLANKDIHNVFFCLTIFNHLGVSVTHLNEMAYGRKNLIKKGKGQIRCKITKLPLPLGSYRIAIAVHNDAGRLDLVSNGLTFNVSSSNYYPYLFSPSIEFSSVLLDHEWNLILEKNDHT